MAIEFKIPELGEKIEKGDVLKVSVAVGDMVKKDQTLLELETDKSVIEVPSNTSGKVSEVRVKNGDKVKVGQVVFLFEGSDAKPSETTKQPEAAKPAPAAPAKLEQPVSKPEAQAINREASKVPDIGHRTPDIGQPSTKILPASPSVRHFAREIGIDLETVTATGSNGRILLDDVKTTARKINTEVTQKKSQPVVEAIELPDFSKWGEIERKPMSAVRRKTATHLSAAWQAPHVTQFDKADITEMDQLRKKFSKRAEERGGKLTMTIIVLKTVASALKVFPQFNASVDMSTDEIILKKYYNVGVAVDTDRGLLVPVIRDVGKKNIIELSAEIAKLAESARDKKLTREDMQGGTFTISNLGGIGGTHFTPIVNVPEVAILGLSRSQIEPVYIDGKFEPRLMLPMSLSYDHRLIDGADAIRFLRWIAEALQQPFLMDLEG